MDAVEAEPVVLFFLIINITNQKINQLLHLPYTRVPPGLLKTLKSVSLSISSDLFIEVAPIGVPAPPAVTSLSCSFAPI
jgi:hypothetical protein